MAKKTGVTIEGMDTVLRNLNKEINRIKGRTKRGLINAGRLVIRAGKPMTPWVTGNLAGSWYGPEIHPMAFSGFYAELGLTAAYAPHVHEMVNVDFSKTENTNPNAQAKFLETPLKELSGEIIKTIKDNARIK